MTSLVLVSAFSHLQRFERLCHHSSTAYPRGIISCTSTLPRSGRVQDRLTAGNFGSGIETFHDNQPDNHCSWRSLVLYDNGRVPYALSVHHLWTPFPRKRLTTKAHDKWDEDNLRSSLLPLFPRPRFEWRLADFRSVASSPAKVGISQTWIAIIFTRQYFIDLIIPRNGGPAVPLVHFCI